jgi:hypothetical protein
MVVSVGSSSSYQYVIVWPLSEADVGDALGVADDEHPARMSDAATAAATIAALFGLDLNVLSFE